MPSQRKKGLKLLGAFVNKEEYDEIKKRAKARGMNLADYLRSVVGKDLGKELGK